jgi:chemotaxis protein CheD
MNDYAPIKEKRGPLGPDPSELFTGARRYRDPRFDAVAVKVFPGEHFVTRDVNEMLVTVLGSCVSACIRDPVAAIGGMNHFMLPESGDNEWDNVSSSMRYGNVAMERLINDILRGGGLRQRLEIKVFGGGNVLRGNSNIGHRNADFVERYLADENLPIAASHLRGELPRRLHYFAVTGKIMMMELRRSSDEVVFKHEVAYKSKLQAEVVAGSAELF